MNFYFCSNNNIPEYPGVFLIQDNIDKGWGKPWNDFGHTILFTAYFKNKNLIKYKLGNIRVLIKDCLDSAEYFKFNGESIDGNTTNITTLLKTSSVVSLPEKISFYSALSKAVTSKNSIREYLRGICDAGYLKNMKTTHESWDGYNGALFRDSSSNDSILDKGLQIALGSYVIEDNMSIELNLLPDTFESVNFRFYTGNSKDAIRENINLIIGKNGLGKTYILKHLTDIMTGVMEADSRPFLNKLLVVAYSPFESFKTKSEINKELYNKYKILFSDVSHDEKLLDVNDYEYIGFKNKDGDFDSKYPEHYAGLAIRNILIKDKETWWEENNRLLLLKKTLRTAMKFDRIGISNNEGDVLFVDDDDVKIMEMSKSELENINGIVFVSNDIQLNLSSGQKIFSTMIPSIISEITDESLLIIDEPELYLHPALEVSLIKMLKSILIKYSSYAIIATHSAVLVREVRRKCVRVLKDADFGTKIDLPTIETYGESIDSIIGEVFDDYRLIKPYQKEIDRIIDNSNSVSAAIDELASSIGDEALIYMTSKLEPDDDSEIVMEPIL
ncbi:AAA family ATPase [Yersinia enterocolitica]|uniref:AAA family ATPase n=1 Tax=Yersinia enterocolitica TaxID=630 RepID=UPI001C6111E5|nr:AAA family ATPase [Yersinia enterocolitica]MBW5855340.1 AAA family ATPase [Yersinia enterocolitica]MBW5861147.1 AAA family ATPase [Yersinia enterocolitica]MBW5872054.1 AAA family ATPase [Yersinia enterocolitica]HEI6940479.1 AAA family ATPase [Yersinia enterocolitica]